MALTANKLIYGTAGTAAASVSGVDSNGTALTFASAALKAADICDTNGATALVFTATASAVNYLTVANAATGNSPKISATGSDTNIGLAWAVKGTGTVQINNGTAGQYRDFFCRDAELSGRLHTAVNDSYLGYSDGKNYLRNVTIIGSNTGLFENTSGVIEINNGTAGTFRDIKLRDVILTGGNLAKATTSFTNGAGASAGTLTNAPAAGNPTKWIPIDDNGVTRYVPAW